LTDLHELFGINAGYIESLFADYQADPESVGEEWKRYFTALAPEVRDALALAAARHPREEENALPTALTAETVERADTAEADASTPERNGAAAHAAPAPAAPPEPKANGAAPASAPRASSAPAAGARFEPLRGVASKIVENMAASLEVPTATTLRAVPVRVLEENRRILNHQLEKQHRGKASFTHLIGWALVKALGQHPSLNCAFEDRDGAPHRRVPEGVNLGIAIDLPKPDGTRSLVVPNVKNAQAMTFAEFLAAVDDVIRRGRNGKLTAADFQGTTLTLTNPGTIGTVSSTPRLMKGQGAIIATGAIEYPAGTQGMSEVMRNALGISRVLTLTSTYDHRVIQGAESGAFLALVHELLLGEHGFFEEIFASMRIPHRPASFSRDRQLPASSPYHEVNMLERAARVMQLVNMYRVRGYLLANLDPLEFRIHRHKELELEYYGLTIWDLDREFYAAGVGGKPIAPLRDILETLQDTYCRNVGVEYMHIADPEQKKWLQERMESVRNEAPVVREEKLRILRKLSEAELFERFLHTRYVGQKRFSLEGLETLIPVLDAVLQRCAEESVEETVIGMAHRGRLNVLANTVGMSHEKIFSEFEGVKDPESFHGSGDVKYHLGAEGTHVALTRDGEKAVAVTLAPNPSHLEAVNPVVEGIARAKQDLLGDKDRTRVLPILIHGDGAFAGQGVVAETLNLSQLHGYRTGGTIHLIVNNQIGYTTLPSDARSSPYCTDVAKMIQAPIFHVNGDDPLAAVRMAKLAFDYQRKFQRDVVLDIVGYRRHGHNEGDEPSFTQPLLYQAIEKHPSVRSVFAEELVRAKDLQAEEAAAFEADFTQRLATARDTVRTDGYRPPPVRRRADSDHVEPATGIPEESLRDLCNALCSWPESFTPHPKIDRLMKRRRAMVEEGNPGVDFGFAENLAYAGLLREGVTVRLSGEDCGRGTFSQRHAVLLDVRTGEKYIPLNHLAGGGKAADVQARFQVIDSLLSEEAVLGFEYGYSTSNPQALVLWEAQFGDFANGAQVQIDQFIAAGEAKWQQPCGLVLLLPHGYDGQGPEHSSARLERFLQLAAIDNIRVAYPSTAAQHFHLLRDQAYRRPLKPLVVMTPKSLLRDPAASSHYTELIDGRFHPVLDDPEVSYLDVNGREAVRRVLLCTGKVAYDLLEERKRRGSLDVAILRVERLYPLPAAELREALEAFGSAELFWVQEEPENMGAARYILPKLRGLVGNQRRLLCIARPESASPATGSARSHAEEQRAIVRESFAGL